MKTIWKWTLAVADIQSVPLPAGADVLGVQMQGGYPQLWALCDPKAEPQSREIAIYGTGHQLPHDPGRYISTFQMASGALVFHAFEVTQ